MCREPHGSMLLCRVHMCVNYLGLSDSYMKRLSARSVEEKEQLELMHANGKVLVGVTLGERIGKGGFGRVFEGMYCSTPCALKVRSALFDSPRCQYKQPLDVSTSNWRMFAVQAVGDNGDDEAILAETNVMCNLSHPSVVRVFGIWAERDKDFGRIFMVREDECVRA